MNFESLAFTENLNKRGGGGGGGEINARKKCTKGGAGPKTKVSKGGGGVCRKLLRLVIDRYGDKRIGGVFVNGFFGGCSFCLVR